MQLNQIIKIKLKLESHQQKRGTKSAKRKLKSLSGRENRWMNDVNHQISKTLVQKYGCNEYSRIRTAIC